MTSTVEVPRDINDPQFAADGHDTETRKVRILLVHLQHGTMVRVHGYGRMSALLNSNPADSKAPPVDVEVAYASDPENFRRQWWTYLRRGQIAHVEVVGHKEVVAK